MLLTVKRFVNTLEGSQSLLVTLHNLCNNIIKKNTIYSTLPAARFRSSEINEIEKKSNIKQN